MTDPYRALCAELLAALKSWSPHGGGPLECWEDREEEADLIARAETELAQPEPVGLTDQELLRCAKIATPCCNLKMWERELNMMRAAIAADHARAALAKWGAPTAQPVAEEPTDEELLRLAREWNSGFESIELHFAADYARAVLAKWGHQ